jgi:hypothetical protein
MEMRVLARLLEEDAGERPAFSTVAVLPFVLPLEFVC